MKDKGTGRSLIDALSDLAKGKKGPRITRDAFLFLTPSKKSLEEDFAQCILCRMYVPKSALKGKIPGDRCIAHGSREPVGDYYSCGFMAEWPTPDGMPNPKVVEDHANELLKIIPGAVTAKDSGLVNRLVQCHRCQ